MVVVEEDASSILGQALHRTLFYLLCLMFFFNLLKFEIDLPNSETEQPFGGSLLLKLSND